MRLWVSMHVSDHSGFHYRQFLLKELITELSHSPTSPISSSQLCSGTDPSSSSPHHHSRANGELSGAESAGDEAKQLDFTTVLQLFHQELELCSDLIQSFPGHETLWSHRFVCVVYQFLCTRKRFICGWFSVCEGLCVSFSISATYSAECFQHFTASAHCWFVSRHCGGPAHFGLTNESSVRSQQKFRSEYFD